MKNKNTERPAAWIDWGFSRNTVFYHIFVSIENTQLQSLQPRQAQRRWCYILMQE